MLLFSLMLDGLFCYSSSFGIRLTNSLTFHSQRTMWNSVYANRATYLRYPNSNQRLAEFLINANYVTPYFISTQTRGHNKTEFVRRLIWRLNEVRYWASERRMDASQCMNEHFRKLLMTTFRKALTSQRKPRAAIRPSYCCMAEFS